jgi:SAM-dependent methyltransferase
MPNLKQFIDWNSIIAELPRPIPSRVDCDFYHCMSFPDGEVVDGIHWDLRGRFQRYIGGVNVAGKTVLDVGTASGFLAFAAEQAGALQVTAIDASGSNEFERVPFGDSLFYQDRGLWCRNNWAYFQALQNSFWYAHAKFNSNVDVYYGPISDIWTWSKRFDIVIIGAIIEHLSDPVQVIGNLARLAKEKVIIGFTHIVDSEDVFMRPQHTWDDPAINYVWWELSTGLYRKIFRNLGFKISIERASAFCWELNPPLEIERPTIVATRIR